MKNNNSKQIKEYLDEIFPNVKCELIYHKDYELLIAVMLSAQTTDKAVNKVTAVLFSTYPNLESLSKADLTSIEKIIHNIGLYKVKAKNVINIASGLISKFNGVVPKEKDELISLPGVGNKTAEVVRVELFNENEFPVDTHIARIAKRLNIACKNDDVLTIENKLKKYFSNYYFGTLHHQLIHFGRYHCTAKNPKCEKCKLYSFCSKNYK